MAADSRPQLHAARQRGRGAAAAFSLVEAIVAAGIVSVMLVAALNLVAGAARTRAADSDHRTALMLAHQLMGEVQQQAYKDESLTALLFGPELGERTDIRADFDDVDDYNNFEEKPPRFKDGSPVEGYAGWKRAVKVSWVSPATLTDSLTDTGLERLEVWVTDPRGRQATLVALRSAHMTAAAPPAGSASLMWTGIELDAAGENPRHGTAGVSIITQPATAP